MKTYKGRVRLPGVGMNEVRVQAANMLAARAMLETQYGRANVLGNPTEIRS